MTENLSDKYDALKQELPKSGYDYTGRTVLITGGAQGIGRCLSLSFALNGARVILLDHNEAACLETVSIVKHLLSEKSQSGSIRVLVTDLADGEAIDKAVSQLESEFSKTGLYTLINNAAIADAHSAHLRSDNARDAFEKVLAVNLTAPFILGSKLEKWLMQARGSIINIASTRAFMSEAASEGYGASKGGIISLTHAMAATMAESKIRVNCISPGWIATKQWQFGLPEPVDFSEEDHKQHPAGRIGRPADIAAACLYLGSEDAGFITGVNLTIDGGMTHKMIYK